MSLGSGDPGLWPEGSWQLKESRDIRNRFVFYIERHEREDHEGKICTHERAGMIAFLCHSIGVHAEMSRDFLGVVGSYIELYDKQHAELRPRDAEREH